MGALAILVPKIPRRICQLPPKQFVAVLWAIAFLEGKVNVELGVPFKSAEGERDYMAAYEATMRLWRVPYDSMDLVSRFGSTHVVVCGPTGAPPLVILHCFFTSLTTWVNNIADFSGGYRVYAPDMMGQPGKKHPRPGDQNPRRDGGVAYKCVGGMWDRPSRPDRILVRRIRRPQLCSRDRSQPNQEAGTPIACWRVSSAKASVLSPRNIEYDCCRNFSCVRPIHHAQPLPVDVLQTQPEEARIFDR